MENIIELFQQKYDLKVPTNIQKCKSVFKGLDFIHKILP